MKAVHSWHIVWQYHQCPACGFINESRKDYEYRLGTYQKDLICERCAHHFTVTKTRKPKFGPFFASSPEPATEYDD